ncbi:MAG: DUF3084 domain-containing protein [Armatimonadota bacterium]|nr:DUF3084 domain-containing protein [Armatimonadota bacterium]
MIYSIFFLVTLVIVSGFIAYWGDLLGRRMGKRRLTLFGLRPRHTAIVMTTITGMVIAALTLTILLAGSEHLRTMLVRGWKIRGDNTRLVNLNNALRKDMNRLQTRQSDLTARMDSAVEGATKAEKAQRLSEENSKRLQEDVRKRTTQLAVVEAEYKSAAGELASKRRELRDTTDRLHNIGLFAEYFVKEYGEAVEKRVIVQSREEIARGVIRPSGVVKRDLVALLNDASRIMAAKGARAPKNGRTIVIVPKPGLKLESDNIDAIARKISSYNAEVVVIVSSARNAVQGEQVPVVIRLYRNKLAFHKGDSIASTTIDGSRSEAHVLNDLIGFFQRDVRLAAIRADMIPVFDPDDPQAMFGTISGQQQMDEFLSVVNRIKENNGSVSVRVMAQQDIKVAERMSLANLDFVISRSSANAAGAG